MGKALRISITFGGLILIWAFIAWATELPKFILPSPVLVFTTLWQKFHIILPHATTTLVEILLGLFFGILAGMISALIVSLHPGIKRWVLPLLIASQAVPVFAIAPLLVLWFDYGMTSKVVMATLIIYFPVTVGFLDGLNRTSSDWKEIAHIMQASGEASAALNVIRLYRYIKIPFALPSLASGIRVATAVAPIGAVVGEWVGSSSGLGYLMLHANGRMQTDLLFAALITLTIISISLFYIINFIVKRYLNWETEQETLS
ncbi:ABC transporter permease subunit [Sneathiella sp. P13V-1]|uniref:ABC transporter permease n=1 Tax=Sneathiella sp. P13V-1 TaxID=2697366 RepID=UPI00187B99C9|nr:ABC transporter permease [Sneathiella sp. P13V-1]MBE7637400.1 ABC transporter permease subunit [Sneathiella sp. P13V-1]